MSYERPLITIDLPWPPSINSLWRSGKNRRTGKIRVYASKKYTDWRRDAFAAWLEQKSRLPVRQVRGKFSAWITYCPPDNRRRDADNFKKAIFDFLVSAGIIEDDSLMRDHFVEWGLREDAPLGVRIMLHPGFLDCGFVARKNGRRLLRGGQVPGGTTHTNEEDGATMQATTPPTKP